MGKNYTSLIMWLNLCPAEVFTSFIVVEVYSCWPNKRMLSSSCWFYYEITEKNWFSCGCKEIDKWMPPPVIYWILFKKCIHPKGEFKKSPPAKLQLNCFPSFTFIKIKMASLCEDKRELSIHFLTFLIIFKISSTLFKKYNGFYCWIVTYCINDYLFVKYLYIVVSFVNRLVQIKCPDIRCLLSLALLLGNCLFISLHILLSCYVNWTCSSDWLIECCLTSSGKKFAYLGPEYINERWWWMNPTMY